MKQITLCLAFHNHQPVGNFGWVFADAFRSAYLPMIECLERHPAIRVSLHYSGPLLDWIRANEPSFLDRLRALVRRNQVEMLSGGYYEPILPAIPEADRIGQIQKMTAVLADELGAPATGMWLAERVWEPQLPSTLNQAGIAWTIVDDTHFKMVGLDDADLDGYYLTEDQGYPTKVFASSKRLRYTIPWGDVEDVIADLSDLASEDSDVVTVMGDDGEKFGVWPTTYEHCWTKGWVDRFFAALEENQEWLHVRPVGEAASEFPARGRIYLPTASYAEMMEWALPSEVSESFGNVFREFDQAEREDVTRFLRGGFWRNFLVKYEEVNTMHKKMLRAHQKVQGTLSSGQLDHEAREQLWQGQCNCPYWHGVFGGIYMTDVRTANFHHLILAETRADALQHGNERWIAHELTDFDRDSRDELIVETGDAAWYFAPDRGGSLFEWDAREPAHNLLSVMTRRPEAYHDKLREAAAQQEAHPEPEPSDDGDDSKSIHDLVILKEKGLENRLHYDAYRRASLIDHFLASALMPDNFADAEYVELGDFVDRPYRVQVDAPSDSTRRLTFQREGRVRQNSRDQAVTVQKQIQLDASGPGFVADYQVVNRSANQLDCRFGIEIDLNLLGGGGNPLAFVQFVAADESITEQRFDANHQADLIRDIVCGNRGLGIDVRLSAEPAATAWWSSIDSISSSEGGFERVHQGSCLLLSWLLHLPPGATWQGTLTTRLTA